MKIQASVYYPVVVNLEVDINDPVKAREEILAEADDVIDSTPIRPTLETVLALPECRGSYVDITDLIEDESAHLRSTGRSKPRYRISCWIPTVPDGAKIYTALEKAQMDVEHYRTLQPANMYTIVPVVEDDDENEEKEGIEGLAKE